MWLSLPQNTPEGVALTNDRDWLFLPYVTVFAEHLLSSWHCAGGAAIEVVQVIFCTGHQNSAQRRDILFLIGIKAFCG